MKNIERLPDREKGSTYQIGLYMLDTRDYVPIAQRGEVTIVLEELSVLDATVKQRFFGECEKLKGSKYLSRSKGLEKAQE